MRTPDGVAVTDERITLTYRELWEHTEDVATVLAARGVTPGTAVAVVADRSIALVVALLAITRAGGAYLPVDPRVAGGAHPSCRRRGGTGPGPG
ncbi:AMP-binding protein [Streptomyces scopuliridis]|uniref:AMP-binding protein n=1 Tax=Streptomyces scopuliridis TaxID=452529 RepID=UPI0036C0D80B